MILDDTGKCIDNANGYGYTSKKKAARAYAFKANGGLSFKKFCKDWWIKHLEFKSALEDEFWHIFKDNIGIDDVDTDDECEKFAIEEAKRRGIDDFKASYLKYM